ncbi:protein shuttle craft-like [Amphibalanus amphitrite]|uniref:protein shuttle craft-like n=1 Tax=Amphibalanus amphitrite TaxID=1232801 RepID=UPI001C91B506|nr:protein shuttle craft-like [Amphibalanus amphitrite]
MSSEEPIPTRTFSRGGGMGRGRARPRRAGARTWDARAGPPPDHISSVGELGRPTSQRQRWPPGARPGEPAVFSDSVLAFISSATAAAQGEAPAAEGSGRRQQRGTPPERRDDPRRRQHYRDGGKGGTSRAGRPQGDGPLQHSAPHPAGRRPNGGHSGPAAGGWLGSSRSEGAGWCPDGGRRHGGPRRGGRRQPPRPPAPPDHQADASVCRPQPVAVRAPSPSGAELGQRERLVEQLSGGRYECLVCVELVRPAHPVWSCASCYHVFHMGCVRRWARTSRAESGGWRCPACQNVTAAPPATYKCFCGKMRDPPWNRRDTPHSCGEVCGRSRSDVNCVHRCTLLCHPGPCPPCSASVTRSCPCGKKTVEIRCELAATLTCEQTCGRSLNCGVHRCGEPCHRGDCAECPVQLERVCFCGKERRQEACTAETAGAGPFCCGQPCGRQLDCGRHHCDRLCHEGECGACPLSPELVQRCPCGARPLSELPAPARASCADPVPTCGGTCGRRLACGRPGQRHTCRAACHAGDCPPCPLQTAVRCRCGFMDREIACGELTTRADDARCQKRCTKKRSCGRHKCGQECCILVEHPCPLTCGRRLTCGVHTCQQPCHVGQCRPCMEASFDELHCECGASVLYPPVACGTPRPPCDQPCSRAHPCGHPVLHSCHSQPECPPCTQLMKKFCYGRHEERSSVPCHQTAVSCGRPCGKPLPCRRHQCKEPCHAGPCPELAAGCRQPCRAVRGDCQHPCGAPCHDGECPSTPCRAQVRVSCECGHRSRTVACSDTGGFRALSTSALAHRLSAIQAGGAGGVDVSELLSGAAGGPARAARTRALQCNAECALLERNRRLAAALQIKNPELSSRAGPPAYPPSMLEMARKAKGLAEDVHQQLAELVQRAQQSKHKSRSVAFAPMNRERRQFVHEYCEHFGCESESYDDEPKRNVVATAYRDRCWLPTLSVLQVVESGPRKIAPAPRLGSKRESAAAVPAGAATTAPSVASAQSKEPPAIDYFDFTG